MHHETVSLMELVLIRLELLTAAAGAAEGGHGILLLAGLAS